MKEGCPRPAGSVGAEEGGAGGAGWGVIAWRILGARPELGVVRQDARSPLEVLTLGKVGWGVGGVGVVAWQEDTARPELVVSKKREGRAPARARANVSKRDRAKEK